MYYSSVLSNTPAMKLSHTVLWVFVVCNMLHELNQSLLPGGIKVCCLLGGKLIVIILATSYNNVLYHALALL